MRLHDIESAVLLPRFAHNAEWEQKALDQVVKGVRAKSFAMGAPYTREAISALSDAELQAFYFQYGIAIYYPDLSRETRENMLFELARVYRSLGTPHSVELLCEYIFDGADKVDVEIHDNLAFNAAGELVDDSLLDLFDVDLFPTSPTLSQDKIERIVENIFRFCRNSQTLRSVIVEFPSVAECNVVSCDLESFVYTIGGDEIAAEPPSMFPIVYTYSGSAAARSIAPDASFDTELQYYASKLYIGETNDGQGNVTRYGWEAEEGTPIPHIDVLLGFCKRSVDSDWMSVSLHNDWWYCLLTNDDDVAVLTGFGVTLQHNPTGNVYSGAWSLHDIDPPFSYEVLEVYEGMGERKVDNYPCHTLIFTDSYSNSYVCIIGNSDTPDIDVMSYKVRITRNS